MKSPAPLALCRAALRAWFPLGSPSKWTSTWPPPTYWSAKPAVSPRPKPSLGIYPWRLLNQFPARNSATLIIFSNKAPRFAATISPLPPGKSQDSWTIRPAWTACAAPPRKWPAPTPPPTSRKTRFACYTNYLRVSLGKSPTGTLVYKVLNATPHPDDRRRRHPLGKQRLL